MPIIKLSQPQIIFVMKTKGELDEAASVAMREQAAINDMVNSNPLIRSHNELMKHAESRRDAKRESLELFISSLGYPKAKLDFQEGQPVLVLPDPPQIPPASE